jgi:hypothetical protein
VLAYLQHWGEKPQIAKQANYLKSDYVYLGVNNTILGFLAIFSANSLTGP